MAEIDPLVAEVLLKGDDEFLESLKKVGEEGEKNFEKLAKAAKDHVDSFKLAELAIIAVGAAITGTAAATIDFIEKQLELSQATQLLADSFGTTGTQLQEIEQIFASSGVKAEQFERFAVRLTTTIAREWPAIAESIKNYATENDAATLRVVNATLRIRDAQNAVGDNSAQRSAQAAKDNTAIELSYIRLGFAAQKAALEQRGAALAVSGAVLGVVAAQQRLDELQGKPVSAADKEKLAISQAQQAVDQARKAEADARLAQQEKAAEAALKQQEQEQAADDLRRKIEKNRRDDAEQRLKDENAVKEAIIARAEAEQKAAKLATTNIESIKDTLGGISKGNKDVKGQVDLTEVSIENLRKGVIALSAETNNVKPPDGFQALRTISKLFKEDTTGLISEQQRLALVTRLAGSSFASLGASAAEITHALEHNSDAFERLAQKTETHKGQLDEDKDKVEKFKSALASLNLTISQLSQEFAAAISPAFAAFLRAIDESLRSNTGILHEFISGLAGIASAIGSAAQTASDLAIQFAKLFTGQTVTQATLLKGAIIGLGVAIVVATGPVGVILAAILLVVAAVGAIRDNWDTIKAAVEKAWEAIKDNAVVKFLTAVLDIVLQIVKGLAYLDKLTGIKLPSAADKPAAASESRTRDENVKGHAEGGMIQGPGSGTSDSILAKLSNGEFVQRAAAVQFWGADFMHAINNMQLPGFAQGGMVDQSGAGWDKGRGSSDWDKGRGDKDWDKGRGGDYGHTVVLNIGDKSHTLKGSKSTVDDLSREATDRQTSSSGSKPSWMK